METKPRQGMRTADETTFEIGGAILWLRSGLRFSLRQSNDERWYLIEDESRHRFFRVGESEYTLLSLLNGKRSLSEAIAKTAEILGKRAFTEQTATELSMWVVQSDLAETKASNSFARIVERGAIEKRGEWLGFLNPVSTKINLFNPDSLAKLGSRWLGWAICWPMALVWLLVVGMGAMCLLRCWDEFVSRRIEAISKLDLVWFALTWMLIKTVHEASHAIVCRRMGGRVPRCGILLLLLVPLPFVDVTSSWRFESKFQRILTSAAGMLSELFIAAIAMLIWANSEPGLLRFHCGNVVIAATLHTLIFNANPLMRFDGYYMLADGLEIPNLYTLGRQHVKSVSRRLFFGLRTVDPTSSSPKRWVIRVYGWVALVWSALICVSLTLAAISLFEGIGFLLGAVAILLWIGVPLYRLTVFLFRGSETGMPNRSRFASVVFGTAIVLAMALALIPAPSTISVPVVVEYDSLETIRADVSGFVSKIHVQSGQQVVTDQLLLELENPDLVAKLTTMRLEKEQSAIKLRQYLDESAIAAWQQQLELDHAIQERLDEVEQLIEKLRIVATCDGLIVTRGLGQKQSTYVTPGTELIRIGDTESIKLIGMLRQDHLQWVDRSLVVPDSDATQTTNHDSAVQSADYRAQTLEWNTEKKLPILPLDGFLRDESRPVEGARLPNLGVLRRSQDKEGCSDLTHDIEFRVYGTYGGSFPAKIGTIRPRAIDTIPHPSFAASNGGPLTVVPREQVEGRSSTESADEEVEGLKLVHPHVLIEFSVPSSLHDKFHAGQRGVAHIRSRDTSFGGYLYKRLKRMIRQNLTESHGL